MSSERSSGVELMVDNFLRRETLSQQETNCPYLPHQEACSEGFVITGSMSGAVYRALMDRGFRRSGRVFYRPMCRHCNQCIPIRVPTATFAPSKSMRRVWRKNADVRVATGDRTPSDEKHELYAAYLAAQHDGTMPSNRTSFEDFLYDPPTPCREFCYYLGRRLVGVSLLDETPGALSSIYMFFDPRERHRSLGTYSILWELAYCRSAGIAYYYLGYWVPGSRTMAYKARYQPAEILDAEGCWRPLSDAKTD